MAETVAGLLEHAETVLADSQVENYSAESQWLLGEVLGMDRAGLLLNRDRPVTPDQEVRFEKLLERRRQREPLQYVLNKTEFMDFTLQVGPGVFIPRPESELLIEHFTARLRGDEENLIDIGTGSGALAIAAARAFPRLLVTAVDISAPAARTAEENARLNGVAEQVQVICTDFLSDEFDLGAFNAVLSNPPYVKSAHIRELQPEVGKYEPLVALDGGADGLDFYRGLVRWCEGGLEAGGQLGLETGHDIGHDIVDLLEKSGFFTNLELLRDYADQERIILAERT